MIDDPQGKEQEVGAAVATLDYVQQQVYAMKADYSSELWYHESRESSVPARRCYLDVFQKLPGLLLTR